MILAVVDQNRLSLGVSPAMLLSILCNLYAVIDTAATSTGQLSATNNASLLWGPYRPNLYLGIRPRIPESLLMGLMWSNVNDLSDISQSTCPGFFIVQLLSY